MTIENACYDTFALSLIVITIINNHYSVMIIVSSKTRIAWGCVKQMCVYYESAAASLSRSFCFDSAFILRM